MNLLGILSNFVSQVSTSAQVQSSKTKTLDSLFGKYAQEYLLKEPQEREQYRLEFSKLYPKYQFKIQKRSYENAVELYFAFNLLNKPKSKEKFLKKYDTSYCAALLSKSTHTWNFADLSLYKTCFDKCDDFKTRSDIVNIFYQTLLNESQTKTSSHLSRIFGYFWAEIILESILEQGQNAVDRLAAFLKKDNRVLLLKNPKYFEIVDKIKNGQCDILKYSGLFDLDIIVYKDDTRLAPVEHSVEIIKRLYTENQMALLEVVGKEYFKDLWKSKLFSAVRGKLGHEIIIYIQRALVPGSFTKPNQYRMPLSKKKIQRLASEITEIERQFSQQRDLLLPDVIKFRSTEFGDGWEGCCFGVNLDMINRILDIYDCNSFDKNLKKIIKKNLKSVSPAQFAIQAAYSRIFDDFIYWSRFSRVLYELLILKGTNFKITVIFMFCLVFKFDKEKMSHLSTYEKRLLKTLFDNQKLVEIGVSSIRLIKDHLKGHGLFERSLLDNWFQVLAVQKFSLESEETEIFKLEESSLSRWLEAILHFGKITKGKSGTFSAAGVSPAAFKYIEGLKKGVKKSIVSIDPLARKIFNFKNVDFEPLSSTAVSHSDQLKEVFLKGTGIYRVSLAFKDSAHDITVINRKERFYIIDPNMKLFTEGFFHKSIKTQHEKDTAYKAYTEHLALYEGWYNDGKRAKVTFYKTSRVREGS